LAEVAGGKGEDVNYEDVLIKLIIEAATAIGGEKFIVSANEKDLAYLKINLKKVNKQVSDALGGGDLKLDDEPIDVMGGVVIRNSDGTKTFHNTLEGRLVNVRSRIEAQVGKTLGVI
jgi:vacuolar-type H+-ATPase subunit E/Vma4